MLSGDPIIHATSVAGHIGQPLFALSFEINTSLPTEQGDAEEVENALPCWLQSPKQNFPSIQGTVYMTGSYLCFACFSEQVRTNLFFLEISMFCYFYVFELFV